MSEVIENQEVEQDYDPNETLKKVGKVQNRMLDAVGRLNMDDLVSDPKIMEGVNALLNGMNSTSVQVIRNGLIQSASDTGAVADAMIERMKERGITLIETSTGNNHTGRIPQNVIIDIEDGEVIEERMLSRGIEDNNFDRFAAENDIRHRSDED